MLSENPLALAMGSVKETTTIPEKTEPMFIEKESRQALKFVSLLEATELGIYYPAIYQPFNLTPRKTLEDRRNQIYIFGSYPLKKEAAKDIDFAIFNKSLFLKSKKTLEKISLKYNKTIDVFRGFQKNELFLKSLFTPNPDAEEVKIEIYRQIEDGEIEVVKKNKSTMLLKDTLWSTSTFEETRNGLWLDINALLPGGHDFNPTIFLIDLKSM